MRSSRVSSTRIWWLGATVLGGGLILLTQAPAQDSPAHALPLRLIVANPDFSPKLLSQVSCSARLVFGFVLGSTGLPSARRLPFNASNCLARALIRCEEAFAVRLAQRVPCAA
jgi:hypothetical protein